MTYRKGGCSSFRPTKGLLALEKTLTSHTGTMPVTSCMTELNACLPKKCVTPQCQPTGSRRGKYLQDRVSQELDGRAKQGHDGLEGGFPTLDESVGSWNEWHELLPGLEEHLSLQEKRLSSTLPAILRSAGHLLLLHHVFDRVPNLVHPVLEALDDAAAELDLRE